MNFGITQAAGNPFLKAGITSGGLSLMGDLLAQTWSSEAAKVCNSFAFNGVVVALRC